MHVGLNLIYLVPGETGGTETYARELIPAIREEAPDLRLTAFLSREAAEDVSGPWAHIPSVVVPVSGRRRSDWVRGEQRNLPSLAKRHGIDLVHSLANTSPAWGTFRRVVTIQDVIYRMYPEAHGGLRTWGMRALVPLAARCSHRIIAPSTSTRDDLVRLLGVSAEKVDVVPDGVGNTREPPTTSPAELRARLDLGSRPVVLTVSAKRPHKNIARLLAALTLIPPERRPVLLLPGYETPWEGELRRLAAQLELAEDTRFLGWVEVGELEALYELADCFVFPSLYEGFGLPVLEAMSRGVPVACSDRGSLKDVAGDAALLFDPEQPHVIARAIERLLQDGTEADRLRAAGRARAAGFSWRSTARGTVESYLRALSG